MFRRIGTSVKNSQSKKTKKFIEKNCFLTKFTIYNQIFHLI